jgi:hypothetical protein
MNQQFILPQNLFYNGKKDHRIDLVVSNAQYKKWDFKNQINKESIGVYVIFDRLSGEDYETPNNPELLSREERNCIYVGEGKILNRLKVHSKTLIGKYAGEIIYYEIPDIFDRKLMERLLIKHYLPIFNKENQYEFAVKKEYMKHRDNMVSELIEEINDMRIEVDLEPVGEEMLSELFHSQDLSYNEIKGMLLDLSSGLNEEAKYEYENLLNRNEKRNLNDTFYSLERR